MITTQLVGKLGGGGLVWTRPGSLLSLTQPRVLTLCRLAPTGSAKYTLKVSAGKVIEVDFTSPTTVAVDTSQTLTVTGGFISKIAEIPG